MVKEYEKISPTAIFCARMRKKHNLPFCNQIMDLLDTKYKDFLPDLENYGSSLKKDYNFISFIEGRYHSINQEITNEKDIFLVELGSGLSPRSLQFLDRKDIIYLETDLSPLIDIKKNIVMNIINSNNLKSNEKIIFSRINPLLIKDIHKIGNLYKKFGKNKKMVILNEGLLMYLSKKEKSQIADNINYLLKNYCQSGKWITTDFSRTTGTENVSKGTENIREAIKKTTKREFDYFGSEKEVEEFILAKGFKFLIKNNQDLIKSIIKGKNISNNIKEILESSRQYRAYVIFLNDYKHH